MTPAGRFTVVPHPAVANYVAAFANAHSLTYRVIEEADHGLSREPWKQAYTDALVSWLKEMMALATEPHAVAVAATSLPQES